MACIFHGERYYIVTKFKNCFQKTKKKKEKKGDGANEKAGIRKWVISEDLSKI